MLSTITLALVFAIAVIAALRDAKAEKTRAMSFIPELLIWAFCSTLLALRVDARRKPEYAHLPSNGGSQ